MKIEQRVQRLAEFYVIPQKRGSNVEFFSCQSFMQRLAFAKNTICKFSREKSDSNSHSQLGTKFDALT